MIPFLRHIETRLGLLRSRIIYDFQPGSFQKLLHFYRTFIRQGDLCFDIGAHTGNHSGVWVRLGAKVVAVEPQPAFARLLEKKFEADDNVTILQKAVTEKDGHAELNINRFNPTISTLSDAWKTVISNYDRRNRSWAEISQVETVTLDSLIAESGIPAFCKIDVEGMEEQVLDGLTFRLPALSFEFFPTTPERTFACISKIEKLGRYRFNYSLTEKYTYVSDVWLNSWGIRKAIDEYRGMRSGDIYAFKL